MTNDQDSGVGPAPPETVATWVKLVASMGPDELADFEDRTFKQWDRASLGDVRARHRTQATRAGGMNGRGIGHRVRTPRLV